MFFREQNTPKHKLPITLIVEDDANVAQSMCLWVKGKAHRVLLAKSVREAREMIGDLAFIGTAPDALLTDYYLTDGNGREIIDAFQGTFPCRPTALMTALDDETLHAWLKKRRVSYFQKPLNTEVLNRWLGMISKQLVSGGSPTSS